MVLARALIGLPGEPALLPDYPNPFNATTVIALLLPEAAHVRVTVYNLLGQRVCALVDGQLLAGTHRLSWDGTDGRGQQLTSGAYLRHLGAAGHVAHRRMLLLRQFV